MIRSSSQGNQKECPLTDPGERSAEISTRHVLWRRNGRPRADLGVAVLFGRARNGIVLVNSRIDVWRRRRRDGGPAPGVFPMARHTFVWGARTDRVKSTPAPCAA